jgi:ribonuclease T1
MLRNSGMTWRRALAATLLALAAGFGALGVQAKGPEKPAEAASELTIAVSLLPPQGQAMLALIEQGGPFKHEKDGVVFGNRERLLPGKPRGYYREYTVRTPGVSSRGARRIVCGGEPPAKPEACYYTEDHYASFRRVVK